MTTIIPIPAFRDNYIWALRNGAIRGVVDPGDAAPVLAWLDANDVRLSAIIATHHHGDHVGGVRGALRASTMSPCSDPRENRFRGARTRLRTAIASTCPASTSLSRCSTFRATRPGISPITRRATTRCCSAATRCSPRAAAGSSRARQSQMWASLAKLAALPAATRVYCGHEYTLANLAFAQAVEPDNADVRARIARERVKRDRDAPTLPSTIGDEHATNPFLRAGLPNVMASAAAHARRPMDNVVDSFATLRQWKNDFR